MQATAHPLCGARCQLRARAAGSTAPAALRVGDARVTARGRPARLPLPLAPFSPAQLPTAAPTVRRAPLCRAANGDAGPNDTGLLATVGVLAMWGVLGWYVFNVAPNLTPLRDSYFIEKLVGIAGDDGVTLCPVYTGIFNIMGIWPAIYASLLVPSGRSSNNVPAWPFITLSFGLGMFALMPYFAFWRPQPPGAQELGPPSKESLTLGQKALESPITPWVLTAGAVACCGIIASSTGKQWIEFSHLIDESRLVHVTTLDFCLCTLLAPYWMGIDADARQWDKRDSLLPVLTFIPLFGPLAYLIMRPKAGDATEA
ncbi:unnamed protein product [Pedinophyceae sp. YPF-701]|nr:unnamed protein product [Pedinophyceae sp. YPF-701]